MTVLRLKRHRWELAAYDALRSAAFEERVNRNRSAADWWRGRAALWLRRAHEELNQCGS